jgi:hypothetical protein
VGGTVPAAFSLGNGYPNPFNPSTTIEFSVAATVPVTITVHDLLGRLVSVLAEGRFNPGTYRATWDADGASSGVYYVRMTAPSFVETRKLMLMR